MDLLRPRGGGWAAMATVASASSRASVDTSLIRERFNMEWCTSAPVDDLDTYWWWARSIRVDPNEIIADDGEGAIWSIPFTTDGTDAVTFGTPVRVAETYVPINAGEGAAATEAVRRRRQRVMAADLERPTKPDPSTAAESANGEERPMTDEQRRALAASLGLAEDATESQIHEAAAQRAVEPPETPDTPVTPVTPAPEAETETVETPAVPEPVAASEAVRLRDMFGLPAAASDADVARAASELRAGAQAGREARRAQQASELDRTVDDAVREGRIAPSARDSWRQAIDAGENPDAASTARATAERDRLTGLATNRVPVAERASVPDTQGNSESLHRALAASGVGTTGRERPQEVTRRG